MLPALILALATGADVTVVIPPVVVDTQDATLRTIAPGLPSVLEWDLSRGPGLVVRSEDDVAAAVAGGPKARVAEFLLAISISSLGTQGFVVAKVIDVRDQRLVGSTRIVLGDWDELRTKLAAFFCTKLGVKPRALKPGLTAELLTAWGAAERLVHEGDPKQARDAVGVVVKKWPFFEPAGRRLAALDAGTSDAGR